MGIQLRKKSISRYAIKQKSNVTMKIMFIFFSHMVAFPFLTELGIIISYNLPTVSNFVSLGKFLSTVIL